MKKERQYRKGELPAIYMGVFSAIFTGVFTAFSVAIDNMAFVGLGAGVGIPIGLAAGNAMEAKLEKEGKLLPSSSDQNVNVKRIAAIILGAIVLVAVIIILAVLLK